MIAVRAATVDDASAMAAVHVSSWRIAYQGIFPDAAIVADAERRRQAWQRYIEQPITPKQRALVTTSSGEVVGFAAFGPSRDDDAAGEIYAMYVEPGLWRQGVGRALLAEAERRLRADGFAEETLWVLDANDRARAFYEAGGWRVDGGQKRESLHGVEVVEVRYRRRLAGA